jgi:hypothetical protein
VLPSSFSFCHKLMETLQWWPPPTELLKETG